MAERLTQITIVEKAIHELLPGEAARDKRNQAWYVGCPSGNGCVDNLAGHDVAYDEAAKTLTVTPSILCFGFTADACGAHYFIERNQIRWC